MKNENRQRRNCGYEVEQTKEPFILREQFVDPQSLTYKHLHLKKGWDLLGPNHLASFITMGWIEPVA